jgi:hypothetical protein
MNAIHQIRPLWGRGTAGTAVEGVSPSSALPLYQPSAGPPPRIGEDRS